MGLDFLLLCTGDNANWLRSRICSSASVPTTGMEQPLGGSRQEGDVLLGAQLTPASAQAGADHADLSGGRAKQQYCVF